MTYKILCADDEQLVREALQLFLESISIQVRCVESGRRCVEEFRASPDAFDLVLVNFDMPGMTGVEVARLLHTIRPSARIALTSGFSQEEVARQSGGRKLPYLAKPFRRSELRRFLQRTFEEAEPSIASLDSADAAMRSLFQALRSAGLTVESYSEIEALVSAVRRDFVKVALFDARDRHATLPLLEELRAEEIPLVFVNASEDAAELLRTLGGVVLLDEPPERVVLAVREAAHGEANRTERSR